MSWRLFNEEYPEGQSFCLLKTVGGNYHICWFACRVFTSENGDNICDPEMWIYENEIEKLIPLPPKP